MTVRLQIETVKNLLEMADASPNSALAHDAQKVFAGWRNEPGLDMDEATRKLIRETLTRWGVTV